MSTTIPHYALYGDEAQPGWLERVHVEQIQERSSMYDYEIDPHVHDGLVQVLYVTASGGEVFVDGNQWPVEAPALIVVPSLHVHGFHFRADVDGPVVTAAQRPLESLAAVGAPDLLPVIRTPAVIDASGAPRQAEALLPLFEAIWRESHIQHLEGSGAGIALLMAVFVQIARIGAMARADAAGSSAGRSRKSSQVERFRALVDANFRARWSVDRYADELALSAGQLSRLCRELLGISAIDVVNARIVHEAERELIYSTLTIKQLAAWLGFADEAYFGRFFKKHTGRTPTEFREAARLRLAPADSGSIRARGRPSEAGVRPSRTGH
jgi:AraC family transcriptional activator of pobA